MSTRTQRFRKVHAISRDRGTENLSPFHRYNRTCCRFNANVAKLDTRGAGKTDFGRLCQEPIAYSISADYLVWKEPIAGLRARLFVGLFVG